MRYELDVNGRRLTADVPPDTPLLTLLRDAFGLTGSRLGCGHGACGACVVLIDGCAAPSCTTRVDVVAGATITTIEGLADGAMLHPVQQAFIDHDAMQCGYCTSGMILAVVGLLAHTPHPSDPEIRAALGGHLCRCGVYQRIECAVRSVSR